VRNATHCLHRHKCSPDSTRDSAKRALGASCPQRPSFCAPPLRTGRCQWLMPERTSAKSSGSIASETPTPAARAFLKWIEQCPGSAGSIKQGCAEQHAALPQDQPQGARQYPQPFLLCRRSGAQPRQRRECAALQASRAVPPPLLIDAAAPLPAVPLPPTPPSTRTKQV
jgi:hypothetical protein